MRTLRDQWVKAFGAAPPPHAARDLLVLALAWNMQAKTSVGLSRWARAEINRLRTDLKHGKDLNFGGAPNSGLNPGATLIREWNGRAYQVLVLETGFAWEGRVWNSLSEIARHITGARWNGPAFFGLRTAKRRSAGARS